MVLFFYKEWKKGRKLHKMVKYNSFTSQILRFKMDSADEDEGEDGSVTTKAVEVTRLPLIIR